jgi:hypothetical protein
MVYEELSLLPQTGAVLHLFWPFQQRQLAPGTAHDPLPRREW